MTEQWSVCRTGRRGLCDSAECHVFDSEQWCKRMPNVAVECT